MKPFRLELSLTDTTDVRGFLINQNENLVEEIFEFKNDHRVSNSFVCFLKEYGLENIEVHNYSGRATTLKTQIRQVVELLNK